MRQARWRRRAVLAAAAALPAGCASIGPATVRRDRIAYGDALAQAAKRETLLNIVKLRYGDIPTLLSVTQLVAGYTLEGRINVGGDLATGGLSLGDDLDLAIGGTFADRPTITYTPVRGDDLARVMLTPLAPVDLVALLGANIPPALTFGLAVQAMNGLRNAPVTADVAGLPDPRFVEAVDLLEQLRRTGRLGVRLERLDGISFAQLVLATPPGLPLPPAEARFVEILDLDPALRRFPLVYGFGERPGREIALSTRSLAEILGDLAAEIAVPARDVATGRVPPTRPAREAGTLARLHVLQQLLPPREAFVAVPYRDSWFWIDDRDFESKQVLTVIMLLLSLVERPSPGGLPVVTIPTG
jgi:hypothetical protein